MPPKEQRRIPAARKLKEVYPEPSRMVQDVPTEILASIFKFMYGASMIDLDSSPRRIASPGSVYRPSTVRREGQLTNQYANLSRKKPINEHVEAVAISYPLVTAASVSHRWRDIVHSMPEHYALIVVYLDDDSPLSKVTEHVKLAGDVPLDVLVTWRAFGSKLLGITDCNEEPRARAIMSILSPIISRCRSFVFEAKYASSLPNTHGHFHGARHLRILKLECMVNDEGDSPPPDVSPAEDAEDSVPIIRPLLTTLVLHGSTWMCLNVSNSWREQMGQAYLDSLTISNFTYDGGDCPLIGDFVRHFSNIAYVRHLVLDRVVAILESDYYAGGEFRINMDNLTVINLDTDFLEEFHLVTSGAQLCFYHVICTPITHNSMPMVHHLRLERIPDVGDEFLEALERFFGHRLDIVNCEEFSDEHLDHISAMCRSLRRVYISGCPDITIQGLKQMILEREKRCAKQDDNEECTMLRGMEKVLDRDEDNSDLESIIECDTSASRLMESRYDPYGYVSPHIAKCYQRIHRLHVEGHPEKLSQKDRLWFEKRLDSFSWK